METVNWSAWLLPILAPLAGWLLWTRLPSGDDDYNDPLETVFAVALCGVFVTALAALLLAELGVLRPPVLLLTLFAFSGLLAWRTRRQSPPMRRPPRRDTAAFLLVVGLAVASVAPASEDILGGRDPGVYANTASWVAQRGTLRVHSEALVDVGTGGRRLFFGNGLMPGFYVLRVATGEVAPQFFHLLPTCMAIGSWLGGPRGALLVPPLFGVLAALSVFFFLRRMLGTGVALPAALLLVLNLVQLWAARNPYSEPATQLGVFASLWCLSAAFRTGGMRWGVLGGLTLGTCFLLRIDSPLLLVALAPALVMLQASTPERHRWLTHAFLPVAVAFALWGGIHGWLFSRPYVTALANSVRPLWLLSGATVMVCAVALAWPRPGRMLLAWVYRRGAALWLLVALALCAAFAAGMWVRPTLTPFDTFPDGRRTYIEESLVRVGWYFSTVGMVLALGGLLILLRRWLVDRRVEWVPFLSVVLAFAIVYFWNPRIHPDHPWMMRRFLPVIVPAICAAIAVAASLLWTARGKWRTAARVAVVAGVGYVLVHEIVMAAPFWTLRERAGTLERLTAFARHVPEHAILLYDLPGTEQRVAMPMAFHWMRQVLPVLTDPRRDPGGERRRGRFEAQIIQWLEEGRVVQYLTRADGNWAFLTPNLRWESVAELALDAPVMGSRFDSAPQKPMRHRERFHLVRAELALERLVPCAGAALDMNGRLTGSTQGLYGAEGRRRARYRWTMPQARVLFPSCDRSGENRPVALKVRAGCWRPEKNARCDVKVSVNGVEAGVLDLTRSLREHEMPIPAAAVAESIGPVEVRFEGPEFIPSTRGGRDHRSLSFQLSTLRVEGHNRPTARRPVRESPGNDT